MSVYWNSTQKNVSVARFVTVSRVNSECCAEKIWQWIVEHISGWGLLIVFRLDQTSSGHRPQTGVVPGDKKHICFSYSIGRLISCHWSVSVHDSDAAKMSRVKKKFLVKFWESGVYVCVWSKMMFLTLPRQGTTPQILKADISCAYVGPEKET